MQRIFITGASSGLGRGLVETYARPGVSLGLLARRADLLDDAAAHARAAGAEARGFCVDVKDTAAVSGAIAEFLGWAGGCDVVIANAGIPERAKRLPTDPTRVAEVIHVNVIGVTNTIVPFVGPMRDAGAGTLVAISSVAGHRALPGSVSYSSAKSAVKTFMDGVRMELHGSGVHAMTICPGFVRTPLTEKNDFAMPFMMDCDVACRTIRDAIERRETTYTFPWQMRAITPVLKVAPEWMLRRLAPKRQRRRR